MARVRKQPGTVEALQQYCPPVIMNPEQYRGQWQSVFAKEQPLYAEIGMGKGQFLRGMALQHPDVNFVGVELVEEVVLVAVKRMLKYGPVPENLRLLWMNAGELEAVFAPEEVLRVYLNFSDPWPKYAHRKRRLTHGNFLAQYANMLAPQGEVHFKTDNQGLFEFSLNEMSAHGWHLKNIQLDMYKKLPEGNIPTEYETKFHEQGMPIYRLEAVKP